MSALRAEHYIEGDILEQRAVAPVTFIYHAAREAGFLVRAKGDLVVVNEIPGRAPGAARPWAKNDTGEPDIPEDVRGILLEKHREDPWWWGPMELFWWWTETLGNAAATFHVEHLRLLLLQVRGRQPRSLKIHAEAIWAAHMMRINEKRKWRDIHLRIGRQFGARYQLTDESGTGLNSAVTNMTRHYRGAIPAPVSQNAMR